MNWQILIYLLNKHTSEEGNYNISFNKHKQFYALEYYLANQIHVTKEDIQHVDFTKDVYCLTWFKNTIVSHYSVYGNTVEELLKQVYNIIEEDTNRKVQQK